MLSQNPVLVPSGALSEEKLLQQILKNGDRERMTAAKRQESELKRAEKRKAEVDGKFVRMYEDWSAGRITEYNFNLLTKKYQADSWSWRKRSARLQAELSAEQQTALDAEKWVALIKQYANPTELTAELLNTLIEKIVIHEALKVRMGCEIRRLRFTTALSAKLINLYSYP